MSEAVDQITRGVGHEVLAHLAFRSGEGKACRRHANAALECYQHAGLVAGVEGLHRLLGLCALRGGDFALGDDDTKENQRAALCELLISHQLSEVLRQRIPTDRFGLGRAGFFARRTHVNQCIVELLLAQDKPIEALRYAELAKARALQDVLAANGRGSGDLTDGPRDLDEILADWPEGVAVVEYFLGTEQSWVFVISGSGQVSAYAMVDNQGKPLPPRKLISQVCGALSDLDRQAEKMRTRVVAGIGYDHTWQDKLHVLYRELLPPPAIQQLRKAKTALFVPCHVLHYLPFAALVVEPDPRKPKARDMKMMMPQRFLLDEPFDICYAPSLTTWDLLRQSGKRSITHVDAMGIVDFLGARPLPGVKKDLDNLQAVFGDRVRQLVPGSDAREGTAKSLLQRRGSLFVGTHGNNVADRPLASYLLFHPDSNNDGKLTAAEIYASRVGPDLVVMSACYSGLADRSPLPGDDLFGLKRALLHSGVHTVVAGMWDVYDGTGPELMRGFFEAVATGARAPAALAESQRRFLQQRRAEGPSNPWLHPYFWAVYTVSGDDRTNFQFVRDTD
jgi:CHAT domain-containing protein